MKITAAIPDERYRAARSATVGVRFSLPRKYASEASISSPSRERWP
ncbi:Uncharacterised protein [Mycobacteroides abscessus subsp. abscessus]|nr:Uncharacterised protein [Mycobacteroides abscessus subsp. abscessus]